MDEIINESRIGVFKRMGIIGGRLGYQILRRVGKRGASGALNGSAYDDRDKLEVLLTSKFWSEIEDKVVIDFGCGEGAEAVEMARRGARKVIGIDIQTGHLEKARIRALAAGVDDRCVFTSEPSERADVIVSIDAFEHFADPAAILNRMRELLKPTGSVHISFGPTWYHPFGGHLFSVFAWSHLMFSEKSLLRWRSDFKSDGATRFGEVDGGLNQMTIRRFEQMVRHSPFQFAEFKAVPIRRLQWIANRLTREITTTLVRCKLVPRV